jgi:RNA polymerase sigma factor (sigma-70 family)
MSSVLRHLRRAALLDGGAGLTDGQLLEGFLARREEAAFEALVRRHGPMVLGVCRRLLRHEQDAEDAFQATFLVLVRKAATIRPRDLVGAWLYGVAYRTAMKARTMTGRRRERERRAGVKPATEVTPEQAWEELLPLLDQELSRLPDKYRVPVVLCELEGRTRGEVARQLKIPEGTVSSRLATARKLLARRLARYGLALSGAGLAAVLSERMASACVTGALTASTTKAALSLAAGQGLTAGAVPARVVALAEGVVKTMLLTKLRGVVAVGLVLAVGAGVVGLSYRTGAAEPKQPAAGAAQATAGDLEELRLEVAALRQGLKNTREQVKELQSEVLALKAARQQLGGLGGGLGGFQGGNNLGVLGGSYGMLGGSSLGLTYTTGSGTISTGPFQGQNPLVVPPKHDQQKAADDPVAEAEAALKKLREHPDDKQATEAVEKALRWLKERKKPDGTTPETPPKR